MTSRACTHDDDFHGGKLRLCREVKERNAMMKNWRETNARGKRMIELGKIVEVNF